VNTKSPLHPVGVTTSHFFSFFKVSQYWRIDFKKKGDFRQKIWAVSPFGDFSPPQKRKAG
jgi:hypothetical protein